MRPDKKPIGRRALIDMRPDRMSIIKDIVLARVPLAEIAKRIGLSPDSVYRYRDRIPEEMVRRVMAEARIGEVEADTDIINQDRMDISTTYDSLARRVEKIITRAEAGEDDAFALAAMEGLRKVLRDIASMQGKLATSLTVNVTLAESKEWVQMRRILLDVIEEVPAAREPLLRAMHYHSLSVTQEEGGSGL